MSHVAELAELEAAIAEAELTDAEAEVVKGGIEQGVPVAEAIALVLEARAEDEARNGNGAGAESGISGEQLAELDKARESHLRRIRRIIGEAGAELEPCAACDGMGLVPPGDPLPEPKPHEWFIACETCGALGQVLTGSHVPGHQLRPCPTCGGRGYLEALDPTGAALAAAENAGAAPLVALPDAGAATVAAAGGQEPTAPRFGRPAWMGDPSIGT